MKKDQKTISNAHYEIKYVAKKLDVPVYMVHMAKFFTGSNDRDTVEKWIQCNKGRVHVNLEEGI